MGEANKSKFSILRNFGWKLFVFSLFIAGAAVYILYKSLLPYDFNVTEEINGELRYSIAYHDFDHDGYSEMMEIRNSGPSEYNILVRNWNGGTIDQANYWETIDTRGLMFTDITGDGYDDILGFTQGGDSLFFYMHDLIAKKVIIDRLYIGRLEEPISTSRYVTFFPICIADTDIYKSKVLIFVARSFTALKPRSVYALDLEKKKIIAEFHTGSAIMGAYPYDLNGDGKAEIVTFGYASGNVHYDTKYKDDKCWLFVLNQKLEPIFPPLDFSQYPAYFVCFPFDIYTERYLLAVPDYFGDKQLNKFIYLINPQGKIYLRTQNPFNRTNQDNNGFAPVVNTAKNPAEVYGWQGENKMIKLNYQLKIVKIVSTPFDKPRPLVLKDLMMDGKEVVFYDSQNYFLAFDEELNLLAKFPNPKRQAIVDFRQNGPGKPLEIALSFPQKYFRLSLVKNKLYSYLPLIFIPFAGLIFLFLTGFYRITNGITTNNKILKYLRFDLTDGVLIVNHEGFITFINKRFIQILNLYPSPRKGEKVVSVLNHFPQIREIINKCLTTGDSVDQNFLYENEKIKFEGRISVQPHKYLFKRGLDYLVILKSADTNLDSNKIQIWSRAVQKMAHDIKTPLSTVALNLKVLQTRLEKIRLSVNEKNELSDDIQMMRTELDNIQAMTKNFLKFSNLDKPHFQAFNIIEPIEAAKSRFKPYINDELSIDISIDKDLKPVWADPQQIEMVFTILIENALAAVKGKGLISINVSAVQYLESIFSESLEIEVADTGPGIAEKDKNRIFDPYFSTKSEGTGMGLAIAKKIVEDNGGLIEVHSKPNFGAVFRFSLPVIKEEEKNE